MQDNLINYAYIKNNKVIGLAVFDNPSEELLNIFKNDLNLDAIILANVFAEMDGEYDGSMFWRKQPYPSWIKNYETNEWEAPIARPEDALPYRWDEESLSWVEIV